jgi:hypothetical protein
MAGLRPVFTVPLTMLVRAALKALAVGRFCETPLSEPGANPLRVPELCSPFDNFSPRIVRSVGFPNEL